MVIRDNIICEQIKFKHWLVSFLDLINPKRQYELVNPHLQNNIDNTEIGKTNVVLSKKKLLFP